MSKESKGVHDIRQNVDRVNKTGTADTFSSK
jgi:hypothetical protein